MPRAGEGEFGVVSQVVEFCKWIATYVLAVAAETYHVHIADEQEILGELSDIISHVYALDSAVARVRLIAEGDSEMNKAVARDLLAAFAPPAYSFCVHTARHILMDVCDPESLPGHLEAIGKLRIDWPSKVIAAKRRIARAVLEADGYPHPSRELGAGRPSTFPARRDSDARNFAHSSKFVRDQALRVRLYPKNAWTAASRDAKVPAFRAPSGRGAVAEEGECMRFGARSAPATKGFVWAVTVMGLIAACSPSNGGSKPVGADAGERGCRERHHRTGQGRLVGRPGQLPFRRDRQSRRLRRSVLRAHRARRCSSSTRSTRSSCRATGARSPRCRATMENLEKTNKLLDAAIASAETVTARQCEFDLPKLPFVMGDAADPIVDGEIRGRWTTRDAHMMAALFDSISYGLQAEFNPKPVPPPPAGDTVPALPPLLDSMRQHLLAQDALFVSEPADPDKCAPNATLDCPRGGWLDRNKNGKPDSADELLIDIFAPGTNKRLFDFSKAEFVTGESLPLGALTPTASLPPPKCKYQQFHIDDVATRIERHGHRRAHLLAGRDEDRVPAAGERKDASPHREPGRHGPRVL